MLGAFLARLGQLRALNDPRAAPAGAPRTADAALARLVLAHRAQGDERSAPAARIGHHELLGRPVAGNVGFAAWPPGRPRRPLAGAAGPFVS